MTYRFFAFFRTSIIANWRASNAISKTVRIFKFGPLFQKLWPLEHHDYQVTHLRPPCAPYVPPLAKKWAEMGRKLNKIFQKSLKISISNQYRPDMVMIWPHMASIPMCLSYTTYTSHIQCHMGSEGPKIALN